MIPASGQMQFTGEDGKAAEEQSVKISTDSAQPTTVRYRLWDTEKDDWGRQIYTIMVYAQRDTNGTQVKFELSGVTVGVGVPDITYDASILPEAVNNNDRIEASAYISGTSDVRAYSTTEGNMDSVTIGIIQLTATRLVKAVDKNYVELGNIFTYTVAYTNSGQENVNVYLYDLLPDEDDLRGTHYDGEAILRKITADLSGGGEFSAKIRFYYSTRQYTYLNELVSCFGDEKGRDKNKIDEMLNNEDIFTPLGTISANNDHVFQLSDVLKGKNEEELTEEMRRMTGIYAVVEDLGANKTLSIHLTVEGNGNEPGDLYRNIANSWLGDNSEPLTSNMVETRVLSRTISGVVWFDADLDGIRDSDEETISGVTCTLFKKDEDPESSSYGQYILCKQDVLGNPVNSVTTEENGAYTFEKLTDGDYIVAFSGEELKKYTGTTIYQVNQSNDSATNDAVALNKTTSTLGKTVSIEGINDLAYEYAIAYRLNGNNAEAIPLHTIDEIVEGNIDLTNYVELYANQDLGLVITGYELPETGGPGAARTMGVLLLAICLPGEIFLFRRKRRMAK